jgi:DMSO/TMAO reductase YedYZ heme-binding membrane subunit
MGAELWWYSARAGGIVAWALLTASVVWGLVMSTKLKPPRVRPAWMLDLHRFLGGLATIFTGVHVGSILLDSYTSFGLADVTVPFVSSWHPDRVAWGIVAMYLLLAVELTSLARRRLSHRVWRRIHVLSLPLFFLATMHFLVAGTDAANPLARLAMIGATGAVLALVVLRVRKLATPKGRGAVPVRPVRPRPAAAAPGRPLPPPVGTGPFYDPGLARHRPPARRTPEPAGSR